MAAPYRLVLTRHGESEWNLQNRFTGWTDMGLTSRGRQQARRAGNILAARGYVFDTVHTSLLARAIETSDLLLARMGLSWLPVVKHCLAAEREALRGPAGGLAAGSRAWLGCACAAPPVLGTAGITGLQQEAGGGV
jgi:bisphosphoglycerate-dependent phosphoglycerate mutase family 1